MFQAERADEVLGVEFSVHGSYTSTGDGFLATVTQGATSRVVMHFTVRSTVMLKEATIVERLVTFLQNERKGIVVILMYF